MCVQADCPSVRTEELRAPCLAWAQCDPSNLFPHYALFALRVTDFERLSGEVASAGLVSAAP